MASPTIPSRTSSRPYAEMELNELKELRKKCSADIERYVTTLKPQCSFDDAYWERAAEYTILQRKSSSIKQEISLQQAISEGRSEQEWAASDEGKKFMQADAALETLIFRCRNARDQNRRNILCQAFWKNYTTSNLGLGIKGLGQGPRSKNDQIAFKQDLIEKYEARPPEDSIYPEKSLWCPISRMYTSNHRAAHIFPYKAGQDNMTAIFGNEAKGELFKATNGIIMNASIEAEFDNGYFCIVPATSSDSDSAFLKWKSLDAKNYKIKVIDPTTRKYNKRVLGGSLMTWKQLDGRLIEWGPEGKEIKHRPRARYLYYDYCVKTLQAAYLKDKASQFGVVKNQLSRPFWGTRGRYVRDSMICGLVDMLGHEYEDLLEANKTSKAFYNKAKGKHDDALAITAASSIANYQIKENLEEAGVQDEDEDEE